MLATCTWPVVFICVLITLQDSVLFQSRFGLTLKKEMIQFEANFPLMMETNVLKGLVKI